MLSRGARRLLANLARGELAGGVSARDVVELSPYVALVCKKGASPISTLAVHGIAVSTLLPLSVRELIQVRF